MAKITFNHNDFEKVKSALTLKNGRYNVHVEVTEKVYNTLVEENFDFEGFSVKNSGNKIIKIEM